MLSRMVPGVLVLLALVSNFETAWTDEPTKSAVSFTTYKEAYQLAQKEHLPLVVFVGAKWCPACRKMEATVLPNLPKTGILKDAAFARVDYDQDKELAAAITGGGPLPQVVIFHPKGFRAKPSRAIGFQTPERLLRFLSEGLRPAGNSGIAKDVSSDAGRSG